MVDIALVVIFLAFVARAVVLSQEFKEWRANRKARA
jgi:hypothetical protein